MDEMVAMRLEWDDGERHQRDYGRVARVMGLRETPPDGLVVHTAGATADGGFRVFDVWESRDHIEAFFAERLMPLMGDVLGGPPQPPARTEVYDLDVVVRT
ncbi:MAG: hypothetical protein JHC74_14130 [Thermoleophilia bacterium]|nr:hypothetical protein [Thermoleophilia bacterium]